MRAWMMALAMMVACDQPNGVETEASDAEALQRTLASGTAPAVVAGCGDLTVHAHGVNDARAILLTVRGDVIERAYAGGDTWLQFALPHPDVELVAQWGQDLTINECNDVMMGSARVVGEALPVSGTLTIDLTLLLSQPEPWDMSAEAELQFDDVVFEAPSGARRRMNATWGPVRVGWFPG